MKCGVSHKFRTISLMNLSQGCKDIEDKLGDLVLWLTKSKNNVAIISTEGNREEAEDASTD